MQPNSLQPSNTWLIKFKDIDPPRSVYVGKDATHYMESKLMHVYNSINNKKMKSCKINIEEIDPSGAA